MSERDGLPVRFGLFLSQAGRSWQENLDRFQLAESLGFDHAWLVDHLTPTDAHPERPIHEAWTLLAAIAALTDGSGWACWSRATRSAIRRSSPKQAVTVDHVSGGRLILGMGAGWHADEHRRYGFELPPPAERVDRLEEAIQILDALMGAERTTYEGLHYRLDDAPLEPKPLQRPRIPLLIAAHRPRMIRLAARYADQWDTFPELAGTATDGVTTTIAERVAAFDAACRDGRSRPGRDPPVDLDRGRRRTSRPRTASSRSSAPTAPSASRTSRSCRRTRHRRTSCERIARERIPALRAEFDAAPPPDR